MWNFKRVIAALIGMLFGVGVAVTEYILTGKYTYWFAFAFGLCWFVVAYLALLPSKRQASSK